LVSSWSQLRLWAWVSRKEHRLRDLATWTDWKSNEQDVACREISVPRHNSGIWWSIKDWPDAKGPFVAL
jgi:ribonuclease D